MKRKKQSFLKRIIKTLSIGIGGFILLNLFQIFGSEKNEKQIEVLNKIFNKVRIEHKKVVMENYTLSRPFDPSRLVSVEPLKIVKKGIDVKTFLIFNKDFHKVGPGEYLKSSPQLNCYFSDEKKINYCVPTRYYENEELFYKANSKKNQIFNVLLLVTNMF
jgi:hypothetical protein